jgi:hypothetical protein
MILVLFTFAITSPSLPLEREQLLIALNTTVASTAAAMAPVKRITRG